MRMAAMPHIRARLTNWDAVVAVLVGILKRDHADFAQVAQGSPYYAAVIDELVRHWSFHAQSSVPFTEDLMPAPHQEATPSSASSPRGLSSLASGRANGIRPMPKPRRDSAG